MLYCIVVKRIFEVNFFGKPLDISAALTNPLHDERTFNISLDKVFSMRYKGRYGYCHFKSFRYIILFNFDFLFSNLIFSLNFNGPKANLSEETK